MKKIAMIPIDNRPVCYCLPKEIANFSADIELLLPPRELLGGLTTKAKSEEILDWLKSIEQVDCAVISLDTIAYGGLVASRRSMEDFKDIENRLLKLKKIIQEKRIKTYAFSSIMRISNNNINEEEKEYWNLWGKKIFEYSYNFHKTGTTERTLSQEDDPPLINAGTTERTLSQEDDPPNIKTETKIQTDVPPEILMDYLATRARNFRINKMYLKWLEDGTLSCLVYSKDDCAQFGLNVKEAQTFEEEIRSRNLPGLVKTGADEIPLSLLARIVPKANYQKIKIYPKFLRPQETKLISKYEDVSIFESVKGQVELCGAKCVDNEDEAQIVLVVNNFAKEQGELVMDVDTKPFEGNLDLPSKPYAIADVLNANGADNAFVEAIFENQIDWENFLGYGGWNTSANTLGSVLCAALIKFLSNKTDLEKFKKQQLTRFLDDWAYQANVRAEIKKTCLKPNSHITKEKMTPFEKILFKKLDLPATNINYTFPWDRFFEVEIVI